MEQEIDESGLRNHPLSICNNYPPLTSLIDSVKTLKAFNLAPDEPARKSGQQSGAVGKSGHNNGKVYGSPDTMFKLDFNDFKLFLCEKNVLGRNRLPL